MGNDYVTEYNYKYGYFETDSREFRGFGYVKVVDPEGHYKETKFHQDDIKKGRPDEEFVYDKYNRPIQQVKFNWSDIQYHSGKVTFPYLVSKTTTLYNYKTGDSKQIQTSYEYDDYGNVTKIRNEGFLGEDNDERQTNITYYEDVSKWIVAKPLTSETTGSPQVKSKYTYDTIGSLIKEERWLDTGSKWIATNFTYDAYGNVLTVTDVLGRTTTTTYEATKTFPASVTNALGHAQSFTYDYATGKIITSTDPNNQTTTSVYDNFGRLIKVTGPGGISELTYAYDLTSSPVKITTSTVIESEAKQSLTTHSWADGLGRTIETISEADDGKYILSGIVKYDSRGQIIEKYLPAFIGGTGFSSPSYAGPHVTYEYDPLGRVIQTIRPDNKVNQNIYSITTIETINENNQRKRVTKDAYGRITIVEEANGNQTQYKYDTLGNLIKTTDALGNTTTISYDSLGRKTSMADPDMGSWSYSYSDVGNLISQTDAKGQTITFEYDKINRLTSKSTSVTYTYDQGTNSKGRLSKVEDSSGKTEFFYDILGREIKTIKTINTTTYTIERTYDSLDRLTSVKYPDNTTVAYTYNKQGGIEKVGIPGDDDFYVIDTIYNPNGQITKIKYANGTFTDYTYDPNNLRLNQLKTSNSQVAIQDLSYTFDPVGNVTQITDAANANTQSFTYDNLNRLASATSSHYSTITYEYDPIGNLTKKGDKTLVYGENGAGPHAVTTYGTTSITYDANGNMEAKGSAAYIYDTENRLTKVIKSQGGEVVDLSISFKAGWNFFSIPVVMQDNSILNVLSSIQEKYEQVSRYDTQEGKWKHYVGNDKYDQFSTIEYGEGYLIYCKQDCNLTIKSNLPVTQRTKDLSIGWNLVSAPTGTFIDVQDAFKNISHNSVKVYNGTDYVDATTLEAGKAYWIHVSSNQIWNIKPKEEITEYVYDGDGGRVIRHCEPRSGEAISTIYIGSSYEIVIDNTTGDVIKYKKNIFMGSNRICEVEQQNNEIHAYFVHADHVGSSNIITDETGQRASLFEYKPFGSVAYADTTNTYDTDKRFNGRTYDTSTGLIFYGGRYYLPDLGRWLTADPTVQHPYDPQNLNRYSFLQNNPINGREINGYGFWSWLKKAWKAIVAVAAVVITATVMVIAPQTASVTFPMLLGQMSLGIAGGVSAAVRGGDVGAGMLFGVAAGTIAGLGLGAMGSMPGAEAGTAHVWGAMAQGAVVGTAAGATTAYAGGKGSIQEVIFWAAIGNVGTATLNGIGATLRAANASQHAVNRVVDPRADALANKAKNKLALELQKMRTNLKVDQSINIALSDAEETAFDILEYTADAIRPGAGVAVEVGRRSADAAVSVATDMGKETGNAIADTIYGTQDAVRKFEEINNDSDKAFIFMKRFLGIYR